MKRWQTWLLTGLAVIAMSVFFLAVMRPPGGQTPKMGITPAEDGATVTVFGLTLGSSTVREAVAKWGRRYELALFVDKDQHLSLEAYFRDAVVGGLNVRLVLSAQLPEAQLAALRAQAGPAQPSAEGGRRYPVSEADQALGLQAVVMAITYLPVAKLDADLVRKRFGEPAERIPAQAGTHWLYPRWGLDVLLGDNGSALLQYVRPSEFEQHLLAPLRKH
jgi:hypothetical protein